MALIKKQLLAKEDMLLSADNTPVSQARAGTTVSVHPVNASVIPFDETRSIAEAIQGVTYTHPLTHPVSIIDGSSNPSKFVKTDALGNTGFDGVAWADIEGKPGTYTPSAHGHNMAEVTAGTLSATRIDITADRQFITANQATQLLEMEVKSNKGIPNGYAPLDSNGKINSSFLSDLNLVEVFTPVDLASMLALTSAQPGDIAYRQDNSTSYMLAALPSSTEANWKSLNTGSQIISVNGKTGIVSLNTSDIAEATNLYFTNERVDDRVAALLQAGTNITLAYNDTLNTLTINANDTYSKAELAMAIGNINSPLLDTPLKNSLAMKAGVGSATFTRASTATYVDRYGVLKTAGIDEPRFEKEGYLNEGASTNLLTYSQDLNNAVWGKIRTAFVANTTDTLDPYGTNLAYKLVSVDNESHSYVRQDTSVNPSTTYTVSCFLKAGTSSSVRIQIVAKNASAAEASLSAADYNFSTGTTRGGGTITKLSNGWVRLQATATTLSDSTSLSIRIVNNSGVRSTTDYIYLFGAQLEALPFATSYIPTTSASVTRAAELSYCTGYGNLPNINEPYSIIFDAFYFGDNPAYAQRIFTALGVSKNFLVQESSDGWMLYANSSTVVAAANKFVMSRIAFVFDGTYIRAYTDGVLVATSVNVSSYKYTNVVPTNISICGSDYVSASNNLNGVLRNLRFYNKALTTQEVALA